MEYFFVILITLFNISIVLINLKTRQPIVYPDLTELPPPIPKEHSSQHLGDFHRITCYENCNIVDIETYHTSTFSCNGFKLDLQVELSFPNAKIEVLYAGSHNRRFRIFNPRNVNQSVELIGAWGNKNCGCNVWKWRIVGNSDTYTIKMNRDF